MENHYKVAVFVLLFLSAIDGLMDEAVETRVKAIESTLEPTAHIED